MPPPPRIANPHTEKITDPDAVNKVVHKCEYFIRNERKIERHDPFHSEDKLALLQRYAIDAHSDIAYGPTHDKLHYFRAHYALLKCGSVSVSDNSKRKLVQDAITDCQAVRSAHILFGCDVSRDVNCTNAFLNAARHTSTALLNVTGAITEQRIASDTSLDAEERSKAEQSAQDRAKRAEKFAHAAWCSIFDVALKHQQPGLAALLASSLMEQGLTKEVELCSDSKPGELVSPRQKAQHHKLHGLTEALKGHYQGRQPRESTPETLAQRFKREHPTKKVDGSTPASL